MCTSHDIKNILDDIKKDNLSGSGTLLQKLIGQIEKCAGANTAYSQNEAQNILHLFLSFCEEMSDFAVVSHFCNYVTALLRTQSVKDYYSLKFFTTEYSEKWYDVNERVADTFIQSINTSNKTILLHSQSSTVITLFDKLKTSAEKIKIIQTESRPMYEGRQQAHKIASMGYSVRIVTDTGFTPLLPDIDIALLGADKIYSDKFVNKSGSYAIALLCKEHNIPLYVLADSRKFINKQFSSSHPENENPSKEVWNDPPPGVTPVNYYFEAVPVDLVNIFFTEKNKP